MSAVSDMARRAFDIFFSAIILICAAPVILLAALAIRIETSGSPFFAQRRVGKNGRLFTMYKLRGMYQDALERYPLLYDYSRFNDLDFYFHHETDPRVTRVGEFIRRCSIDELPNFINVILGDMTLVGPRPEIPDVLQKYGEAFVNRYVSVKPGVTCLSKISGRDRLTKRETILLDLDYLDQRSLSLDISIVWRTIKNVIGRKNVFGREPGAQPQSEVLLSRRSRYLDSDRQPEYAAVKSSAVVYSDAETR
jgi:lipopolysaccharide/colanic/teichoic acid biosynthesis glycosyltransferase